MIIDCGTELDVVLQNLKDDNYSPRKYYYEERSYQIACYNNILIHVSKFSTHLNKVEIYFKNSFLFRVSDEYLYCHRNKITTSINLKKQFPEYVLSEDIYFQYSLVNEIILEYRDLEIALEFAKYLESKTKIW